MGGDYPQPLSPLRLVLAHDLISAIEEVAFVDFPGVFSGLPTPELLVRCQFDLVTVAGCPPIPLDVAQQELENVLRSFRQCPDRSCRDGDLAQRESGAT